MSNVFALWLVVGCALLFGWIARSSRAYVVRDNPPRPMRGPIDIYSVGGGLVGSVLGVLLCIRFLYN